MPESLTEVRALLDDDLLGPEEIQGAFGVAVTEIPPLPFGRDALAAAHRGGEMLVLRLTAMADGAPLTILQMLRRFPELFDQRFVRTVGYQLKDEWGIEIEPLAATDTCAPGWALVRKDILEDTRNLAYEEQEAALQRYARVLDPFRATVRRRSAVETVYDTLLYFGARKMRLLENRWDWSGTRTIDGGYLNIGGFTTSGLQVLSFSRAVRHGGLGVCPTRQHMG